MNDERLNDEHLHASGLHVSDKQLLLYADRESRILLGGDIQAHLESCSQCRFRLGALESTLEDFAGAHRETWDTELPPASDRHALLKARLADLAAQEPALHLSRSSWLAVLGQRRAAFAAAMIAACLLLAHLHAQGSRRVVLMVGAQQRNSYRDAEAAYRRFAAEAAMPAQILRVDEAGGEAASRQATLDLLRAHPEIDGLCVMVDAFAIGAAAAASELGRAIPTTLRLATRYDGVLARECRPPLTALAAGLQSWPFG